MLVAAGEDDIGGENRDVQRIKVRRDRIKTFILSIRLTRRTWAVPIQSGRNGSDTGVAKMSKRAGSQ